MKKLSIAVVVALFAPVLVGASERVTIAHSCRISKDVEKDALNLPDVLELAMCNNPSTRGAWLFAQAAGASHDRSLSAYYPKLDLNAGIIRSMMPDREATITSAGASLGWLLYDFGGREAMAERTYQAMMSSEFSYNQTLQNTAYQALAAYWNTLALEENLEAVKANEVATGKAVELSSKKLELGMVSRADMLQAQTAHQQARLDITVAEQKLLNVQAGLSRLLGLPATLRLNLESFGGGEREMALAKTMDELMEVALEKRMDLRAQLADVKAAKADVEKAQSGSFPSISAIASNNWQLYNSADSFNDYPMEAERRVGAQLSWNIFSGFETTYGVKAAHYQAAAAEENYRLTLQGVELDVVNAYNDYTTGLKTLELAKTMVEAATENEAVARGSYQAGKGDILRLLDAQARLVSARQQLISARYGLYTYQLALLRATGELFKENIEGVN